MQTEKLLSLNVNCTHGFFLYFCKRFIQNNFPQGIAET